MPYTLSQPVNPTHYTPLDSEERVFNQVSVYKLANLARMKNPDDKDLNKILDWLDSRIEEKDFFSVNSFEDTDLRVALMFAVSTITTELDQRIDIIVKRAQESEYEIRVELDDMYESRVVDFDKIHASLVEDWRQSTLKEYLEAAKKEISWLKNEEKRLATYMDIAFDLKRDPRARSHGSYYKPTEREPDPLAQAIADAFKEEMEAMEAEAEE